MNKKKYNNFPMGISSALARNPEARMNFALASIEEQKALIESCSRCHSFDDMCNLVDSHITEKKLQQSRGQMKPMTSNP